jgi:hypothetical protein
MKPRLLFRASGYPIHTSNGTDWKWGLIAALLLVLIYGYAGRSDERIELGLQAAEQAREAGFAAGRVAGRREAEDDLVPNISAAYAAGLNDGLYALEARPHGRALALACEALKTGARP